MYKMIKDKEWLSNDKEEDKKSIAFDHVILRPNQQIGLHSQQTWELSYVVQGSGECLIGDIREPFGHGDAVLVAPGMLHQWLFDVEDVDEEGNIENITIIFSTEMLHSLAHAIPEYTQMVEWYDSLGTSLKFSKEESKSIGQILLQMDSQPLSLVDSQTSFYRIPLLLQLLGSIYEKYHLTTILKNYDSDISSDGRIKKIEIFLTCNYQRKVNLEDLAKHVGMSRSSMCAYFKRKMGKTIFHYLIDLRISIAKQLLASPDLNIAQCCFKSGFNDIPHFNRTFKRWVGMTPKEYRYQKVINK